MSDSKIQIKVGNIEFSGEGNQDWLCKQLDKVLEQIPKLLQMQNEIDAVPETNIRNDSTYTEKSSISGLSLINIAGKLNCKSGSDLALASAAFLHFVEGKITFSRDDLSSTMKKAFGFYKETMMNNLTSTLTGLEKNGVFNKSSNLYSIQATKVTELNAALSK
jgi:hypothetical protein